MADEQIIDGKDPLSAALAREARVLFLPISVFVPFACGMTISFFVFGIVIQKAAMTLVCIAVLYLILKTMTWNDDKGFVYLTQFVSRMKFFNRIFGGISYDPARKAISNGTEFSFKKHTKKDTHESNNIPYLYHINKHTIKLKSGDIMSSIRLEGFNFETQAYEDLVALKELRNSMLRQFNSRVVVYVHYVRRAISVDTNAEGISNFFASKVVGVYRQLITKKPMMVNDVYLTLLMRRNNPNDPPVKRVKEILTGAGERESVLVRDMDEAIQTVLGLLKVAQPRLLEVKPYNPDKPDGLQYCEQLELLSFLVNMEQTRVPVLDEKICNYLSTTRKIFKASGSIQFKTHDGTTRYAAVMTMPTHNYPETTDHRMIDAFLQTPHELVLTESFGLMDKQSSASFAKLKMHQHKKSDDVVESQINDIEGEVDDISSGRTVNGHFTFSVLTHAKSEEELKASLQGVRAAFANSGLIPRREDILAEPVFWHSLPGNKKYSVRTGVVNTRNFSGLASLHNTKTGKKEGNHWGPYLAEMITENHSPYYLNFHVGDVGHTSVVATSGAGKTTILNFLLACAEKFQPKVFHFDFEYGSSCFVEAMGGVHTTIMTTIPSGWNPLHLPDTNENRAFLYKLFCFMGKRDTLQVTSENINYDALVSTADTQKINEVIGTLYDTPMHLRQLAHILKLFGTPDEKADNLRFRLDKWAGSGAFSNLFDNATDNFSLDDARLFSFEMKHVIKNNDYLTAASMYIFHRIDQEMIHDKPFIIVIEEGQRYVENPINVHWLNEMLTTYRRRNGMVVFVTPTPEIILSNPNLTQQFKTNILFCNDKLNADTYAAFGCSKFEIDWLRQSPGAMMGKFLVKQGFDSVILNLNLYQTPAIVSLLSGNENRTKEILSLKKEHGNRPEDWLPAYWESQKKKGKNKYA